ncbi:MAG: beta-ketoacyl synthase [Chlorobi bacterium]|nr:beta-ketoacyl synthase [Chlorobiota bacterium]
MAYFIADNIISSLGFTTVENFNSLLSGDIGIEKMEDADIYPGPFLASTIDKTRLENEFRLLAHKYSNFSKFTVLEKLMILSIDDALSQCQPDVKSDKTAFIFSTTKGNIDLLDKSKKDEFGPDRHLLWKMAEEISNFFGNPNKAICISNACISGVLALNTAAMYINAGQYETIVVCGGDLVSRFVVSGFMSFLSLSDEPCKPFDKDRKGLSLGEAAGTIILSEKPSASKQGIKFMGGATANDANHISGPSRTGEGSYIAIKKALFEAGMRTDQIDHISAHGTATPYNDEMESIAIARHNLQKAATNGIKGSVGHTLGAAGIIETAILLEEMRNNTVLKTSGYKNHGVGEQINVSTENSGLELNTCLKMASGFGGSNAALILQKI